MESITQFFPSVSEEDIARPLGEVNILIGMEYADMHLRPIESNQGLILYENDFGTGKIVGGKSRSPIANKLISAKDFVLK